MSTITLGQALKKLKQGEPVALPTETVYGLAAPINDESALKRIFTLKKRPFFDPLIVHVESFQKAKDLAHWDSISEFLAKTYWPGPLTIVLPKTQEISSLICAGGSTVALRSPKHPIFRQAIADGGVALAAPSANRFGKTSPTLASHVETEFAGQVAVVDGGPCDIGIESTILQVTLPLKANDGPTISILRPGRINVDHLEQSLTDQFKNIRFVSSLGSMAPGQLQDHYQPDVPLILISMKNGKIDELSKDLIHEKISGSGYPLELSIDESPEIAARRLYADLIDHSAKKPSFIYCKFDLALMDSGPWRAIGDRLKKAASYQLSLIDNQRHLHRI